MRGPGSKDRGESRSLHGSSVFSFLWLTVSSTIPSGPERGSSVRMLFYSASRLAALTTPICQPSRATPRQTIANVIARAPPQVVGASHARQPKERTIGAHAKRIIAGLGWNPNPRRVGAPPRFPSLSDRTTSCARPEPLSQGCAPVAPKRSFLFAPAADRAGANLGVMLVRHRADRRAPIREVGSCLIPSEPAPAPSRAATPARRRGPYPFCVGC
jgi:hypothetical protein